MNNQPLQPLSDTASPFDSIRQCKDGRAFWSARDLQELLGYEQWRRFEETMERAMIACKNVGQNPDDQFASVGKLIKAGKGAVREVNDYHLTRFACYLTAMNGDPRKPEIAQAQAYFALKTREAEIGPARAVPLYTISDALRQRAFANEKRVPRDLFSTQLELTRELHYWEGLLNAKLDNQSYVEQSVGRCFSTYARTVLHIPEAERRTYRHQLPNGLIVDPWAYPLRYLPDFRQWLREVYFVEHFEAYARYHARRIGAPVQRLAAPKKRIGAEQMPLF